MQLAWLNRRLHANPVDSHNSRQPSPVVPEKPSGPAADYFNGIRYDKSSAFKLFIQCAVIEKKSTKGCCVPRNRRLTPGHIWNSICVKYQAATNVPDVITSVINDAIPC